MSAAGLGDGELEALEALVGEALAAGRDGELPVLGYGEISLVLGWPAEAPRFACKRMPAFDSRAAFESYRRAIDDYVERLEAVGIAVAPTEMRGVDHDDLSVVGYVIQPILPAATLAPAVLHRTDPAEGHPLVAAIADAAAAAVSPRLGLDAQLANWAWDDGRLTYIDVSTPLEWDDRGASRLDVEPLAKAYPAILRPPLRRFIAPRILDGYRKLRSVYEDLAGNLIKERLTPWLPAFLAATNRHLARPLTEREVHGYYRSDARLWALLLRLRRLDRAWRLRTGRPYPFLLPGPIER
ncbi:MAG: hypothetical protein BroJett022_10040 [Actinomycetes bacterium]|nr:MAG: hypothetical protein BroJett022_10040 [Actinomycetes bacterium]